MLQLQPYPKEENIFQSLKMFGKEKKNKQKWKKTKQKQKQSALIKERGVISVV